MSCQSGVIKNARTYANWGGTTIAELWKTLLF